MVNLFPSWPWSGTIIKHIETKHELKNAGIFDASFENSSTYWHCLKKATKLSQLTYLVSKQKMFFNILSKFFYQLHTIIKSSSKLLFKDVYLFKMFYWKNSIHFANWLNDTDLTWLDSVWLWNFKDGALEAHKNKFLNHFFCKNFSDFVSKYCENLNFSTNFWNS